MFQKIIAFILGLFGAKKMELIPAQKTTPVKSTAPSTTKKESVVADEKQLITLEELKKASRDGIPKEYLETAERHRAFIEKFRKQCGIPMICSSYLRTKDRQKAIYKAKAARKEFPFKDGVYIESKVPMGSQHIKGTASDWVDTDKKLANWVKANLEWCKANGYYFEDPDSTPTWLHIQSVAPKSGKTIFKP